MFRNFFDIERLIHSIKTTIACLVGLLIYQIIGFSGGQWIVITIAVVMCAQIYVGSVIQKSYFRFLGTLIGCLFATLAIETMGVSFTSIATAIGLSSFIFSYIATSNENLIYAGTLGAVTTIIIMLGPNPTILYAGERFLEISIGLLIATLISQFVLPIHARTHLRRTQAKTLEQLRLRYLACMSERTNDDHDSTQEELDESIIKLRTKQRQLAKESLREPLGEAFDPKLFLQSLNAEKEMLRAIDFMHHALSRIKEIDVILNQSTALQAFNNEIVSAFQTLVAAIQSDKRDQSIHLPNLIELKKDLANRLTTPKPDEWLYIDSFLFGAEILIENLTILAKLYHLTIYTNVTTPLQIDNV